MKKLSSLPKEVKTTVSREIDANASIFQDRFDEDVRSGRVINMGLCSTCKELVFTRTQYGTTYAKCGEWRKQLNGVDLVVECTSFKRHGEMSLYDMKDIAVLIDVEKHKIGLV